MTTSSVSAPRSEAASQLLIAPACHADIPQLCALLTILFNQEAEFQPDPDKQAQALHLLLDQPERATILALSEGERILAMVSLQYGISTACGGKVAQLEDLVVLPPHRNRGLGRMLLQAALAHASECGCLRVTLLTDHDNAAAIRFYHRHGFEDSAMLPLRLALGATAASPPSSDRS